MPNKVRVVISKFPAKGGDAFSDSGNKLTPLAIKMAGFCQSVTGVLEDFLLTEPTEDTLPFSMSGRERRTQPILYSLYVLEAIKDIKALAQIDVRNFSSVDSTTFNHLHDFPAELKSISDWRNATSPPRTVMHAGNLRLDTNGGTVNVFSELCSYLLMAAVGKLALAERWDAVFVAVHPNEIEFYLRLGFYKFGNPINSLHDCRDAPAVLMIIRKEALMGKFLESKMGAVTVREIVGKLVVDQSETSRMNASARHIVYEALDFKTLWENQDKMSK